MSSEMDAKIAVQKYKSLVLRMHGHYFSWALARRIVGGEKRLVRLMEEEKIHGYKPEGASNAQWKIDAAEVIANVKPLSVNNQIYDKRQ